MKEFNREEIKSHFLKNFASSPHEISEDEVTLLVNSRCLCDGCSLHISEMYDFPEISTERKEVYCEDCYSEKYYQDCPICEESFGKPTQPSEHILIISRETVKEYRMGIVPGFYQVIEYPFFRACCVFGFDGLYENAIKLIRECDINSMLRKIYRSEKDAITADDCCESCMKKYTGQTKLENNYLDKNYGKKHIKLLSKVIAAGK